MIARVPRVGALATAALACAACGVPTSDTVEVAEPDDVPFGLLEPDRVPVAVRPETGAIVEVHLFDPDSETLVPVVRQVATTSVEVVIAELEAGPSDAESLLGLRSALVDLDAVDEITLDGATAFVHFDDSFATLGGNDQVIAIAQLVFTLTERPTIDQVAISVDGAVVEVPRADGTLTRDPLTRVDYASFAPP